MGVAPQAGFGPLQALNAAFVRVRADGVGRRRSTGLAPWVDNVGRSVHLPGGTVPYAALLGGPMPYLQTGSIAAIPLPALHGTIALRGGRPGDGPHVVPSSVCGPERLRPLCHPRDPRQHLRGGR